MIINIDGICPLIRRTSTTRFLHSFNALGVAKTIASKALFCTVNLATERDLAASSEFQGRITFAEPAYRLAIHSASMDTRRILYHGSCTRCHHLHYGVNLWLPLTDDVHSRYPCESCGHPMFGIGRSSPQSSLASLLTIPPSQVIQERSPEAFDSVAFCSDRTEDLRVSEEVSRPLEDQVTIIRGTQRQETSLINSSQTSATNAEPAEPTAPPEARSVPNRPTQKEEQPSATRVFHDHEHGSQGSPAYTPTHSLLHARSAARKLVERLRRGKLWQKFRNGKRSDSHQPIIQPLTQDAQTMTEPVFDLTLAPYTENILASHAPTIAISNADEQQPNTSDAAQRPEESGSLTTEVQQQLAIKLGRIQTQRKEATLKDKFLKRPTCLCGEGCHCKDNESYPTTAAQTSNRPASISNSYQHPLRSLLLGSSATSTTSPARGRTHNHSPSRHVAFTDYHEPSNAPFPVRLVPNEDDEHQQVSRHSTTTSMSATSQVTTAVNSSSSGSARNIRFPILTDQHIYQLVDLFRLDANWPTTREAIRVLMASRGQLELSTSVHSSQNVGSRTNSMSVASEEGSSNQYGSNGRVNGIPHNSTTSLSHLHEPDHMRVNNSDIHEAAAAGRTHSSSDATVQPHSPQSGHPAPPDQLSAELGQLSNHNEN